MCGLAVDLDFDSLVWMAAYKQNHVINWSGAKILEREGNRKTRQAKESIWIQFENQLHEYDHLLITCSTSRDHKPDETHR